MRPTTTKDPTRSLLGFTSRRQLRQLWRDIHLHSPACITRTVNCTSTLQRRYIIPTTIKSLRVAIQFAFAITLRKCSNDIFITSNRMILKELITYTQATKTVNSHEEVVYTTNMNTILEYKLFIKQILRSCMCNLQCLSMVPSNLTIEAQCQVKQLRTRACQIITHVYIPGLVQYVFHKVSKITKVIITTQRTTISVPFYEFFSPAIAIITKSCLCLVISAFYLPS